MSRCKCKRCTMLCILADSAENKVPYTGEDLPLNKDGDCPLYESRVAVAGPLLCVLAYVVLLILVGGGYV